MPCELTNGPMKSVPHTSNSSTSKLVSLVPLAVLICSLAFDIYHTPWPDHMHLYIATTKSTHIVAPFGLCDYHHDDHLPAMNDRLPKYSASPLLERIAE